jgi:hypothetical protein
VLRAGAENDYLGGRRDEMQALESTQLVFTL